MSKALRTIKALLISGVLMAALGVVMALFAPFAVWLVAVFRFYPQDLLIPTIGEAYASFPHGKEMLLGSAIVCFLGGVVWYPLAKLEEARREKRRARARQRAAAEAQPGESFFYFDRNELWQGLILSSIFLSLGFGVLFVAVWAVVEDGYISRTGILMAGSFLGGTALFSMFVSVCLRGLRHHGPALIIGSAGIWTARSGPDAIPWRDIAEVQCVTGHMELRFRPPGRLRRSLRPYQFFRTKLPWLFGYRTTKLMVNLALMSIGHEDVVLAVRKFAPEMDLRVRQ